MENIINRHEKIALMFSGGKDSTACLYLLQKWWDKIDVIWVNTGAAFPESIEIMEKIKKLVPRFIEWKSDQAKNIELYGYPTDLVPSEYTAQGQYLIGRKKEIKLQSHLECCARNIWLPGMDAARASGATLIIRGQRNDEEYKSPIRSGDKVEGIEYLMPIQDWSRDDVMNYLKEKNFEFPEHFKLNATSLDCWNCTAFCGAFKDREFYMKEKHPELFSKRQSILQKIRSVISKEITSMDELLAMGA